MNKKFNMKNKGFSLSEVLISLVVLGVVATLVLPTIIAETEKAETASKVRKYQKQLTLAAMNLQLDYGTMFKSPLNAQNTTVTSSDHANGWNALKTKFNLIQDCGTETGTNCWGSGMYKFLNGNNWVNFNTRTSGRGLLLDGSSINYESAGYSCMADKSSTNTGPLYNSECGVVFIDINGPKPPNQAGRDVFTWHVLNNGTVLPFGAADDNFKGCDPTSTDINGGSTGGEGSPGRGGGCTMQVLRDGKVTY